MNTSSNKWYSLFFFKEATPALLLILLCLVGTAVLGVMTPTLITDLSSNYSNDELFYKSLWALFYNFLGVYLTRVLYQLSTNKYVRQLIQNARTKTYNKWISSSEHDSEKYPQGEIISRLISDTDAIRDLVTSGAFGILIDICFVVSCLIGFIRLNMFTGFFIGATEIFATLGLLWGSRLMRDVFKRLRASQAKVNRVTANMIGGSAQIYYTDHKDYASKKGNIAFDDFLEKQNQANNLDAAYYAVAESLYPIILALLILILPYSNVTQVALVFAIVDLIQRSISPIKEISGKIANIQRAQTGIERIQHFITDMSKYEEDIFNNKRTLIHKSFKELHVHIDSFSYPLRKNHQAGQRAFSLENIYFNGKPGELIGIVGLSGSGKSTLLNILAGNVITTNDQIYLKYTSEGEEYKVFLKDLEEYRRDVSIVSQESHIFTESLMFNITLTHHHTDESRTRFEAAWKKFEEQIPYLKTLRLTAEDKIVPNKLSLGQKQLIAGVRACYLKKNIVFFDEISSALDSELELALRKCILLIQEHSLTIIVAHRVETVLAANKILVMENGRVIASGNHQELLASSQSYKDFILELSHS